MHLERLDGPGIAPRRSASLPSPRPGGRARGLILGVALACAAARPAPGQEPAPPAEPPAPSMHRFHAERWKGFEPGDIAERLSRAVDPTDEQRSQIQGLVERFRAQNADVLARSRALRDALRGARESGTRPSREDLDALARQYGYPGRELAPAVQGLREDVLDLLTPDQKQRLGTCVSAGGSAGGTHVRMDAAGSVPAPRPVRHPIVRRRRSETSAVTP